MRTKHTPHLATVSLPLSTITISEIQPLALLLSYLQSTWNIHERRYTKSHGICAFYLPPSKPLGLLLAIALPMDRDAELANIRRELNNKFHNKDLTTVDDKENKDLRFILYTDIEAVWAGGRLGRFLRGIHCDDDNGTGSSITDSQIQEAREGLLRIISLLIEIHWPHWSRFKNIFFGNNMTASKRRDNNLKNMELDELRHESFLGDPHWAKQFWRDRWTYIPMTLTGDEIVEEEETEMRLPLVRQEIAVRKGGFGMVTKEMILPGQIELRPGNHVGLQAQANSSKVFVARKQFLGGRWETELRLLKAIRSSLSVHKLIVTPLSIVKMGTELNIITPWADMDLEDYFLTEHRSMFVPGRLFRDLMKECSKLAAAIKFLHKDLQAECESFNLSKQQICHADLKPRNILVFKTNASSTGNWAITDFGVSEISISSLSSPRDRHGLSTTNTLFRQPANGIHQAPDQRIQRRGDIWSFGCILVQVFSLGLENGHPTQPNTSTDGSWDWQSPKNRFWSRDPGGQVQLNPDVKSWIENLPERYNRSYTKPFLTEIQSLLSSMLETDFHERPKAGKVYRRLLGIYMLVKQGTHLRQPVGSDEAEHSDSSVDESSSSTETLPRTSSTFTNGSADQPLNIGRLAVGPLVNSIRSGTVNDVKNCLENEPDIEELHEGERPLIYAIEQGDASIIATLLEHKPDLDVTTRSSKGETPLHLAVSKGDARKVKVLIDAILSRDLGYVLNEISEGREPKTPLMEAASRGHVAVVSQLLDSRADTTICVGPEKKNCLHFAVDKLDSDEELLRAFVGKMDFNQCPRGVDGNPIKGYETPMMQHIALGIGEMYGRRQVSPLWKRKFRVLVDGDGDVNMGYQTKSPLQLAIETNKVDIVKELLMAGATLPYKVKGRSPQMKDLLDKEKKKQDPRRGSATSSR